MHTNRERVKYLRAKLSQLSSDIQKKNLQEQYMALAQDLAQGVRFIEPVDDNLWEAMLPQEQDKNLLAYYHTLRAELLAMMRELEAHEKKSRNDKLHWLDSKWIRRILTTEGLIQLAVGIYQAGHYAGLWFEEEE
jgi:hypothetical protein